MSDWVTASEQRADLIAGACGRLVCAAHQARMAIDAIAYGSDPFRAINETRTKLAECERHARALADLKAQEKP